MHFSSYVNVIYLNNYTFFAEICILEKQVFTFSLRKSECKSTIREKKREKCQREMRDVCKRREGEREKEMQCKGHLI